MAKSYAAINTYLYVSDGASPETYLKVAKVGDIGGPTMSRGTIDVTTHDTTDQYMDFISDIKDGGQVSLNLIFDPNEVTHSEAGEVDGSQAGGLKYLFETGEKRNMKIVMPTSPNTRFRFIGMVIDFKPDFKVRGAITATVTVKVSKKPVLEAGS